VSAAHRENRNLLVQIGTVAEGTLRRLRPVHQCFKTFPAILAYILVKRHSDSLGPEPRYYNGADLGSVTTRLHTFGARAKARCPRFNSAG